MDCGQRVAPGSYSHVGCKNVTDLITDALITAMDWCDAAMEQLDWMATLPEDYRRTIWSHGFDGTLEDPSLQGWFGDYSDFLFLTILDVVSVVWSRLRDGEHFRCFSWNACGGSGVPAYYTPGVVHLCPSWVDGGDYAQWADRQLYRAWVMLHEHHHFAMAFTFANFPRDVRHENCEGWAHNKCYFEENSHYLAEHFATSRMKIWNQGVAAYSHMPAALANIDNYVSWMRWRFEAWGYCIIPRGAPPP